jgi:hypothetical protein
VHFFSELEFVEGFRYSDMEPNEMPIDLPELELMKEEHKQCYMQLEVSNTQQNKRKIYIKSNLNDIQFQCKGLIRILSKYFYDRAKLVHSQQSELSDSAINQALAILSNPNKTSDEIN